MDNWEEGLNKYHDGAATSAEDSPTAEPAAAMSAKAQEDLKRAISTVGVKYEIRYHTDMPKRDRIYEGDDWCESSDNDNPVWRSMLPAPTAPMDP